MGLGCLPAKGSRRQRAARCGSRLPCQPRATAHPHAALPWPPWGREFWLTSNKFLARLYVSPLVTVAAIRGACPAGGCCLSLCCDYRVMTEVGHIGLNEVALGIAVPKYWAALMGRVIGAGPAEAPLQLARLLSPLEALRLRMVDELVHPSKLLAAAEAAATRMLGVPDFSRAVRARWMRPGCAGEHKAPRQRPPAAAWVARLSVPLALDPFLQETKRLLREDFAKEWVAFLPGEAEYAWAMLASPPVVKQLGAVLAALSGGGKKAAGAKQPRSKL